MDRRATRRSVPGLALLALLWTLAPAGPAQAGVEFDVDLERYRLEVREPGGAVMSLPVAIGTPAHPTPRGSFQIRRLIRRPAWNPGRIARSRGQRATPASWDGPMGVAKMPFRDAFSLHAGADPLELGKPVTLGCVQLTNRAMQLLVDWLDARAALSTSAEQPTGEILVRFREPAMLRIR